MDSNTRYCDEVLGLNHRALARGIISINRKTSVWKTKLGHLCCSRLRSSVQHCFVCFIMHLRKLTQGGKIKGGLRDTNRMTTKNKNKWEADRNADGVMTYPVGTVDIFDVDFSTSNKTRWNFDVDSTSNFQNVEISTLNITFSTLFRRRFDVAWPLVWANGSNSVNLWRVRLLRGGACIGYGAN